MIIMSILDAIIIIEIINFLINNLSALSDVIGQKLVFKILLVAQLLTCAYYAVIAQLDLDPWLWPYGELFWTLGGGYARVRNPWLA